MIDLMDKKIFSKETSQAPQAVNTLSFSLANCRPQAAPITPAAPTKTNKN